MSSCIQTPRYLKHAVCPFHVSFLAVSVQERLEGLLVGLDSALLQATPHLRTKHETNGSGSDPAEANRRVFLLPHVFRAELVPVVCVRREEGVVVLHRHAHPHLLLHPRPRLVRQRRPLLRVRLVRLQGGAAQSKHQDGLGVAGGRRGVQVAHAAEEGAHLEERGKDEVPLSVCTDCF